MPKHPEAHLRGSIYASLSDSISSFSRCFFRSSFISLYVLMLSMKNATVIKTPPIIEARESEFPVRNQSTRATRKIVRSAATEDRTGDVREMSTRKEPENAILVLASVSALNAGVVLTSIGTHGNEQHPCCFASRPFKCLPSCPVQKW